MAKKKKKKSAMRRIKRAVTTILVILLVLLLAAVAGIFGIMYFGNSLLNNGTTLRNVYAGDINIGEKTYDEVLQALEEGGWSERFGGTVRVVLPRGIEFEADYAQAGTCPDPHLTADAAMKIGHTGGWQDALQAYMDASTVRHDVAVYDTELDRTYIEDLAKDAAMRFERSIDDSDFVLDKEASTITLVKGAGAYSFDTEMITEAVLAAIAEGKNEIQVDAMTGEPEMPDFVTLHEQLFVEGADAYYDPETNEIVEEINGIDFDVEEAERLWNEAGELEEIVIPITLYEPKVTADMLNGVIFRDLLGEQTTNYYGSSDNRICNIGYAADIINGTILQPGEVFSFNGTVGERTEERGFKSAGAYADGAVVQEIGGGICQVSSTIYAAMIRANLETVSRRCHTFTVSYLPKGVDATVSWPNCDFQFRNNTNYPIKLVLSTSYAEKSITVKIYGTNETGGYVEYGPDWWPVYDSTYTSTQVGWGAICYRKIFDKDGNMIDKIVEGYSSYDLHSEDIAWPPEYYAAQSGGGIIDNGYGGDIILGDPPPVYFDPTPEEPYIPDPGFELELPVG